VERSFSFIICGWNITSLFDQEFPKFGQFFPCAIEEKLNVNSEHESKIIVRSPHLASRELHWVREDLDILRKRGEWTFRQLFCDERLHLSSTRTWPFLKNPYTVSKAVVVLVVFTDPNDGQMRREWVGSICWNLRSWYLKPPLREFSQLSDLLAQRLRGVFALVLRLTSRSSLLSSLCSGSALIESNSKNQIIRLEELGGILRHCKNGGKPSLTLKRFYCTIDMLQKVDN